MVEEIFISRFLSELLPLASSSINEEELAKAFIDSIKREFGFDNVEISGSQNNGKSGQLEDYIINTRKAYIDNQLSDYSAFPELINYKSKGYSSCAIIPIIGNGRVISSLKLLSTSENKFTDKMINTINIASSFFAFSFVYKTEVNKNTRLAEYFDAAFGAPHIQLLVSKDDKIIKANKEALLEFEINNNANQNIKKLFGLSFNELKNTQSTGADIILKTEIGIKIYHFYPKIISEGLIYLNMSNITNKTNLDLIQHAVSGSQNIFFILANKDFNIYNMSKNLEIILGYNNTINTKKSFMDILKFDNKNISWKENLVEHEFELHTLKGTVPMRAIITKGVFGYGAILFDRVLEKYVKESTENNKDFINITSDIIVIIDKIGNISEYNPAFESFLGYSRNELKNTSINRVYKDTDIEIIYRDMDYVKNGGKVDNTYINLIDKRGFIIPGVQFVRKLRGINEEDKYIFFIRELATKRKLEDFTEREKDFEKKLQRNKNTSDLKSEFIYNITHELKTPLTSIKGFSSLLYSGNGGELNDIQKDYVNTIIDESNRLMLIIQQVLDATKLEADKVKLEYKEVDLKSIYDNSSIKGLEEVSRSKGLKFEWIVEYDVPNINADPNRLIQVFVNLIGNAIKFTEKGGITVTIKRKNKSYVECIVSDTGIGISEEDKKSVFKKFYQAQKRTVVKQESAGTGLGLAITRDIVKLHGGRIIIESQPGAGSTFKVILPIKRREKTTKKQLQD